MDSVAAANLREAAARGLTQRSCVEVAFELAVLFCGDAQSRRDALPQFTPAELEALERAVTAAWDAALRISARDNRGNVPRTEFQARVEAPRMEALKACAEAKQITVNPIVATVFTPWGSGWCDHGDPAYGLRPKLWEWAAERARARDYERRSRSTQEGPQATAVDVTGEEHDGTGLLPAPGGCG